METHHVDIEEGGGGIKNLENIIDFIDLDAW